MQLSAVLSFSEPPLPSFLDISQGGPGERFVLVPPSALWTGEVPSLRGGGGLQLKPEDSTGTSPYPLTPGATCQWWGNPI